MDHWGVHQGGGHTHTCMFVKLGDAVKVGGGGFQFFFQFTENSTFVEASLGK